MAKKIYICRECGYGFPSELSHLIENKIQVYCEMCGTPFSLAGVEFKQQRVEPAESRFKPYSREALRERSRKKFSKAIQVIDSLAYIPILIFSCIFLTTTWIFVNPNNLFISMISNVLITIAGFMIVIYDIKHITPRIKQEKYNEVLLDAFCFGILGCIIYGTGTILIIKGIMILIYSLIYQKSEKNKVYHFGLKLKNSINHFSGIAGFIVLVFTIIFILNGIIDAYYISFGLNLLFQRLGELNDIISIIIFGTAIFALILFPSIFLIIDMRKRERTREKTIFNFGDFIVYFIIGAISTGMFSIGIFILLKSILIFFLFVGKPFDWEEQETVTPRIGKNIRKQKEKQNIIIDNEVRTEFVHREEEFTKKALVVENGDKIKEKPAITKSKKELKKEPPEEAPKEIELRLHESLLPVKDQKDKKIVKQYLARIFKVVSRDIKKRIMELEIPEVDKEEIVKELLFLTKKEQIKYIEALSHLYKEIPLMLIERITKLPNVKPDHYDKIIGQLKYMDFDEQMEFVLFLEEYAK